MKKLIEQSYSYVKSEPVMRKRNSVPILAPGIGTRISEAAERVGTRKAAAEAAGVSSDSLQRYIREEVEPTFSAMAGLARRAGVRLSWLAFDAKPMLSVESVPVAPLDRDLLQDVIQVIEEHLVAVGGVLEPEKKAELIVLVYEEIREQEGKMDRSRILKLVKLAS